MTRPFCPTERLKSFRYAAAGIVELFKTQHNVRIHAAATVLVIASGAWLGVSRLEWCALVLTILAVWAAEALNTSIEYLADAVTQDEHPLIKKSKDAAAGAVLLAAIGAVAVGLLVFGPYIL